MPHTLEPTDGHGPRRWALAPRARALAAVLMLAPPFAPALAQDVPGAPPAGGETASARLAALGPEHAWMEPLAGKWDVQMLVYPEPGTEPMVAEGLRATREPILEGRYLREELRGEVFGRPAARDGLLGYNRLDDRFEWVTVDTFEPGQMVYAGRSGEAGPEGFSVYGRSNEAGMGAEPTGRARELRFEFAVEGPDRNVQRIFARHPGGEEFLFVEQRFARAE